MVGSAIFRQLSDTNSKLITFTRSEVDLTNQNQVKEIFESNSFDQVYMASARVGGIHANNTYPGEFIYENLMIQNNIIHQAHMTGVKRILFLGSSCIYPKLADQPISEKDLLGGKLEPTNEPYAIAKIAGIKLCESYNRQYGYQYRSIMPTNLYGKNDNYHPENSHVIPALIRRFHEAKVDSKPYVTVWGSGTPKREFLHVDDMASASIFIMNLEQEKFEEYADPMLSHINIGSGTDHTIKQLTEMIADVVGFRGEVQWDKTKPDGSPRKLLDSTKILSMGWSPKISLKEGLEMTYKSFLKDEIKI